MPACKANLRELRLQAGLSQSKLAQAADLDRTTVSHAEQGLEVSDLTISKIVKALSARLDSKVEAADIRA